MVETTDLGGKPRVRFWLGCWCVGDLVLQSCCYGVIWLLDRVLHFIMICSVPAVSYHKNECTGGRMYTLMKEGGVTYQKRTKLGYRQRIHACICACVSTTVH